MLGLFRRKAAAPEARSLPEIPDGGVPVSAPDFVRLMGWDEVAGSAAGISVTIDAALGVPAIWAAVNFLSGTLAGLPLNVYRVNARGGKDRVADLPVARLLHDAPNDEMSSFELRKLAYESTFTAGRGLIWIERNRRGDPANLWPIDVRAAKVRRVDGRKVYDVRVDGKVQRYPAADVIDLPFMLRPDMLGHRSPILSNRDPVAMAIASVRFGSKVFQSGGLPPAVLEGPFQSAAAAQRASDDVAGALAAMAQAGKPVLVIPAGHKLTGLGFNAEQMQLLELQRFCVEQVARIYSLPPTFLQDLSRGTYSNTEQQDLHMVKHTLHRWVKAFEQEVTLKLFGRAPEYKVEMNIDGLLRGDIKTRMEAHAQAIQHGIYSPAHAAQIEDKPYRPEADVVMIQGATVPLVAQLAAATAAAAAPSGDDGPGDDAAEAERARQEELHAAALAFLRVAADGGQGRNGH